MIKRLFYCLTVVFASICLFSPTALAAGASLSNVTSNELPSQQIDELLTSDTPLTVILDEATGKVLSVTLLKDMPAARAGSDAYLQGVESYFFKNKGITTGKWKSITNLYTGKWTCQITWEKTGKRITGPKIGHYKKVLISETPVTVVKVQLW